MAPTPGRRSAHSRGTRRLRVILLVAGLATVLLVPSIPLARAGSGVPIGGGGAGFEYSPPYCVQSPAHGDQVVSDTGSGGNSYLKAPWFGTESGCHSGQLGVEPYTYGEAAGGNFGWVVYVAFHDSRWWEGEFAGYG